MPQKDLRNEFSLNETVYFYDEFGDRIKGRIEGMYQKYGTVVYEISGADRNPASVTEVTTYHRAEGAIDREGPHGSTIKHL